MNRIFLATVAAALAGAASAGSVGDGVRSAQIQNKDALGYRWNSLVAGLIALKLQPSIMDSTVVLERLLPGLSCDGVKLASDEFTWRQQRPALRQQLLDAAASFPATEVYSLGTIKLRDYDFQRGGFPFDGSKLGFNNQFREGAPVGDMTGTHGLGGGAGGVYNLSATLNTRSQQAMTKSPDCSLYVKAAGGSEADFEIVGMPYLLDPVLPVPEATARQLIAQYPRREFVLLEQFTITGSELGRDPTKVFLKAGHWKYSLCEATNPRFVNNRPVDPYCTKVVLPLEMRPLTRPYDSYIGELPSWARATTAGEMPGGGTAPGAAATSKTYTINSADVVKGLGTLFGKAKEVLGTPPPVGAPAEGPPPDAKE